MALNIEGESINRIRLIDDDRANREAWVYPVEELELGCSLEEGPINDLQSYVRTVRENSDAVICDHHLKVGPYSNYNGAEVVSRLSQSGVPAILCTRYEERIEEIRRYRKHIPALLNPKELNPDSIVECLKDCILEIKGRLKPSRRPWRALVKVEDVDRVINENNPFVEFTLPGWDSSAVIRLLLSDMPKKMHDRIEPGYRCHVKSNIGAESQEELYFEDWELE